MADQRPAFRFRLPWSQAAPLPRPTIPPRPPAQTTATTTPTQTTPQTAAAQPPPRPSVTTTATPPTATPQAAETQVASKPSTTTTSAPTTQTAERAAYTQPAVTTTPTPTTTPQTPETQNTTQPTTATISPVPTAERPPFRPPGVAPAQGPPPRSQTSRTESQPSSPSRATTQSRVPSQPASPSRTATQSRAPSLPSTPPRVAPQPRVVSLPSSPSRRSPQLPSTTPRTATPPRSPSALASIPAGQTSSPPPPSSTTAQPQSQPTTAAVTQPTSTEVASLHSDKQEPKPAVSESQLPEVQPKTATTAGMVYDSQERPPIETTVQPNEMTQQPSKESGMGAAKVFTTTEGPETPAVTQISNTSTINGKSESFPKELQTEETKEVKEVMQDAKDKAHDETRHKDTDLTGEQGQTLETKDLPSIPSQSEHAQHTIATKVMIAPSASNGKQTKTTTPHPGNKTSVVDTRQKLGNSKGEHMPLHKEIRDDISKLVNKMAVGDSKRSIDDRPVSVITLAGENRGASMHVGSDSSRKEGAIHIRRGYKIKPDDSAGATTDGEESFKGKYNNPKTKEDQASDAYVNSNVQGINNSILFNSSAAERNPGVHLIFSYIPTESKKPSGKQDLLETRKAEYNMTPSQKLTHEPTVRRRCLRGLFLESSDSDSDSAKPRRHGCRVGCSEKSKENNVDVL